MNRLAVAGYGLKERGGRRNRYHVQEHLPLPEHPEQQRAIGEVLHLLTGHGERARSNRR